MDDGILQRAWHELNEFLHLTGVSLTGFVKWEYQKDANRLRALADAAEDAVNSMADELNMPRSKAVQTIKPEGCRPGASLTTTSKGIFTLDELMQDHEKGAVWSDVKTEMCVQQDGTTVPVLRTFANGVSATKIVTLRYGMQLESTPNHKWFVTERKVGSTFKPLNGWVRADELRPGDTLEVNINAYQNDQAYEMQTFDLNALAPPNVIHRIIQPQYMNEDLAWLLGYLWGDGAMSVYKWRLRFVDQHVWNLEKAARVIHEQFGILGSIRRCTDRDAYTLEVGSHQLWLWFINNGLFKYDGDQIALIPLAVRASRPRDIIAFISGFLDADGCAYTQYEKATVTLTQADDRFTDHLQHVAAAVGLVFGRSLNTQGVNLQETKHMWLMGLAHSSSANACDVLLNNSEKMARYAGEKEWFWNMDTRSFKHRVLSVEDGEEKPTYDVEVGGDHWYYAGSVKSHNTASKILDTTEGVHKPLGKYIINRIRFSKHDPAVGLLEQAGYDVMVDPYDETGRLVAFPVVYEDVEFEQVILSDGRVVEVNTESAIDQLNRYKFMMDNYVRKHNCSNTISYAPEEVPGIIDWIYENWDSYVGVSFLYRNDPTKTAEDLGYPYLPQTVVSKEEYDAYVSRLKPMDIEQANTMEEILDDGCAMGACPIK